MDVDDEDDFYAPEEAPTGNEQQKPISPQPESKSEQPDDDLEEGEEEDEGLEEDSDSVNTSQSTRFRS
jgi:hypothetical protein